MVAAASVRRGGATARCIPKGGGEAQTWGSTGKFLACLAVQWGDLVLVSTGVKAMFSLILLPVGVPDERGQRIGAAAGTTPGSGSIVQAASRIFPLLPSGTQCKQQCPSRLQAPCTSEDRKGSGRCETRGRRRM